MLRKTLMAGLFISQTGCICSEKDGRPGLFLTSSGQLGGNAPKNWGPRAEFPAFFIYNRVLFGWFYSEIIIGFLGAFAPKSPGLVNNAYCCALLLPISVYCCYRFLCILLTIFCALVISVYNYQYIYLPAFSSSRVNYPHGLSCKVELHLPGRWIDVVIFVIVTLYILLNDCLELVVFQTVCLG